LASFADILNKARRSVAKTGDYFGIGRKGLGQFGVDIKRSVQPAVLNTRKIASDVRRSVQPAVLNTRKVTSDVKRYFPVADRAVRNFRTRANTAVDRVGDNLVNRYNANGIVKKYNAQPQWAKTLHNYSPIPIQGRIARDYLFRPTTRALVAGAGTIGNYMGKKEVQFTPKTSLEKMLLGTEPVYSVKGSVIKNAPTAEKYLRKVGINDPASARTLAATAAMAGIALDLTPFGGGKKATVKGGSKLLEIAKKIHPNDKIDMVNFIDQARLGRGKLSKEQVARAYDILDYYRVPADKLNSPSKIANTFEELVEAGKKKTLEYLRKPATDGSGKTVYAGSKTGYERVPENYVSPKGSSRPAGELQDIRVNDLSRDLVNSIENNRGIGDSAKRMENAMQDVLAGDYKPVLIKTLKDGTNKIVSGKHHLEVARNLGFERYPVKDVTNVYKAGKILAKNTVRPANASGALLGLEVDEEGNVTVNPYKATAGVLGMAVAGRIKSVAGAKGAGKVPVSSQTAKGAKIPLKTGDGTSGLKASVPQEVAQTGRIEPQSVAKATTELEQSKPILQSSGEQGGHIASQKSVSYSQSIPDRDLISQLTKALKGAKPLRGQQEAIYSAERGKKFARLMSARDKMAGEKGFYSELGALKGEMPKIDYATIRGQFDQTNVDRLFNMIKESKKISDWDKINAQVGLSKLLGEKGMGVPTRGEIEHLYQVFGSDFTEALLSKRPMIEKLKDTGMQLYNLPRSMMAGVGDFSATLMQNALFAYRHPVTTAKNFVQSLKYFASNNFYKASMEEIGNRANAELFRKAKLSFTDVSPIMRQREEQFMASMAEKIPGLGRLIKASSRAYTGFLNKMRADVADQLINTKKLLGENPNDQRFLDTMGTFVNMSTGRGDLGSLERSANVLAQGLFSARKLIATFQTLNPAFYVKADPLIRKEALKTMGAFFGGAATITGLAQLAGADVSTDPTSSDFGKIKIGNTRVNMFGTYQQLAVLTARMIKGYATSSTTGKKMTLGDEANPYSPTRLDLLFRFFESKEHPTLSLITGGLKGQNQIGEKFDLSAETLRRFMPMLVSDSYDLYKEHGSEGLLGIIPAMLGLPTQTYGSQVPNLETTKSGKPTIKLGNTPDIAESIMLKLRGEPESNIPKEQWPAIIQQKQLETQAQIQKERLQEQVDKGKINLKEFDGKVQQAPDGSFYTIEEGKIKTFKNKSQAGLYQFEKQYGDNSTAYAKYSLEADRLKDKNDFKGWADKTINYLDYYEKYINTLDQDTSAYYTAVKRYENLLEKLQKYTGYGGFTKPKSSGGSGGRSPSVTKAITMAKATPGVSKIKATTGSYNSAKSRGKIKVAVAPPSVKIPISKKYTGKQLAQMR
jgi:hypothetical protein